MYRDLLAVGMCMMIWAGFLAVFWMQLLRTRPDLLELASREKLGDIEDIFKVNSEVMRYGRFLAAMRAGVSGLIIGSVAENCAMISVLLVVFNWIEIAVSNRKVFCDGAAINAAIVLLSAALGFQIKTLL